MTAVASCSRISLFNSWSVRSDSQHVCLIFHPAGFHAQSPRMSATQRILPVLPAKTILGRAWVLRGTFSPTMAGVEFVCGVCVAMAGVDMDEGYGDGKGDGARGIDGRNRRSSSSEEVSQYIHPLEIDSIVSFSGCYTSSFFINLHTAPQRRNIYNESTHRPYTPSNHLNMSFGG